MTSYVVRLHQVLLVGIIAILVLAPARFGQLVQHPDGRD